MYKVAQYTGMADLEEGLNKMSELGYSPQFIQRSNNGYITVVYKEG